MTIGTDSVYPASLPTPQQASIRSVERRVLAPEGGLFEARAGQTDRLSMEDIAFPPLTPAQALVFDAWWRDDLLKGGLWFSAAWPRPEGQVAVARRFLRPPDWEWIGAPDSGYWRVTGTFEVRGTGELPINPDPPSAWNPDDKLSLNLPVPIELTESFRVATRETNSDSFEGGVRGTLSHDSGRWYFELEILNVGLPGHTQNMQFGVLDDSMKNEGFAPFNDGSNPDNTSVFVVCSSRTADGIVFSSYPTFNSMPGDFGGPPIMGDIYGFAVHIGTGVDIYRNGVLTVSAPLPDVTDLYPYFNAGSTEANGPDPGGTGESIRIRTGKRQFAYFPPTGYFPWG